MKNSVKRIFSFVMILAMLMLSLSMVAFATEGSGSPTPATALPTSQGGATPTNAPTNTQGSPSSGWVVIVVYILFFVVVGYFLIYRPNKKRKKQEEELRGSIILGDEVTTIGGIVGKVVNIKDDNITIETSVDKTLVEFKNWAIRDVKKLITDDEPETK